MKIVPSFNDKLRHKFINAITPVSLLMLVQPLNLSGRLMFIICQPIIFISTN